MPIRRMAQVIPALRARGGGARLLLGLALLAGVLGCDRVGVPNPLAREPEPSFLWGVSNPADPAEVRDLAGPHPFLVRLESPYTGGQPTLRSARSLHELAVHPGIRFMIVLPYRPRGDAGPDDWTEFVERAVRYYARQPQVRYLQITQGINSPAYADVAGDHAPFSRQALLEGLRAAATARADTHADLRLGFSFYAGTGTTPEDLLGWLAHAADVPDIVDWVGVDCYPGTGLLTREVNAGSTLTDVLQQARNTWLPVAGLDSTPLILTQIGVAEIFPTSGDAQGRWLDALGVAAWNVRETLNLRAFCWYETRDKDSTATLLAGPRRYVHSHFGLCSSAGWRKPSYGVYRDRIAASQPDDRAAHMVD